MNKKISICLILIGLIFLFLKPITNLTGYSIIGDVSGNPVWNYVIGVILVLFGLVGMSGDLTSKLDSSVAGEGIEGLTGLEQRGYAKSDETIKRIAQRIKEKAGESGRSYPDEISHYITHKLKHIKTIEKNRNRSASQIIQEGYNGCTDIAIIFIALLRELGVPARYVETFDKKWLEQDHPKGIQGHSFVELYDGKEWKVYDPLKGPTPNGEFKLDNHTFVVYGRGPDFTEIYRPGSRTPENLQDVALAASKIREENSPKREATKP